MLALLTDLHWGAIAQIVAIDLLLGGDNAVVIALACRNLPAQQRMRGVLWGTAGAIVLRVLLIGFCGHLAPYSAVKNDGRFVAVLDWHQAYVARS